MPPVPIFSVLTHALAEKDSLSMETFVMVISTSMTYLYIDQLFNVSSILYSDIDECDTSLFDCIPEAQCENTFGSYRCVCQPGYAGNGSICEGKPH